MFEDQQQYKGNRPADTESEGFVPIEEQPVDYLEGLRSKLAVRDAEDAKPAVEEYRKSLPGPSPDPEYYDYTKMLKDNMQPKLGGEGVAPFPVEYYAKGHEPFDEWVMDANTGTYQPGNATTRVAIGAARDIAQGAFEYLLQGSDEDIMTLTEGVIAGGKIAAGVGVKALTDMFADNPDPATYNDIIDDAIADAHNFAYDPPSLPEIAGGDPETAQGIVENIGRDLSILLGGLVAGNKAMPAQMFAVEVPKMMNWYRKTMGFIKDQAIKERGVIAAELIYSKVGEGGNLSTLLNDMGFGNELTEWLDSSVEGEEDQMALKNVAEGIITSKMLQGFAVTAKGTYNLVRSIDEGMTPRGLNAQKGMVNLGGDLPTDEASRMARAKEMGFDKDTFHATTYDIDAFDMSKANPESDWGAGIYSTTSDMDASINYSSLYGQDLTNKIEMRADQLEDDMGREAAEKQAQAELSGGKENIMELKVKIKEPFKLGGEEPSYLESNFDEADGEDMYDMEPTGPLVDFIESLMQSGHDVDNVVEKLGDHLYDGGISAKDLDDIMRKTDWYAEDDMGRIINSEVYRQALEDAGFDGVIDATVHQKFGYGSGRQNYMEGIDEDTEHVVLFNPNQARLRTAKFDPSKKLSPELLAGIAGVGVVASEKDDQPRDSKGRFVKDES